ncbi:unnamed protein product [Effrenium voratum]|nr:unnamed protein product [Effrenium voratum]
MFTKVPNLLVWKLTGPCSTCTEYTLKISQRCHKMMADARTSESSRTSASGITIASKTKSRPHRRLSEKFETFAKCRISDVLPVPRGLHKATTVATTVGLLVSKLWISSISSKNIFTTASLSSNGLSSLLLIRPFKKRSSKSTRSVAQKRGSSTCAGGAQI